MVRITKNVKYPQNLDRSWGTRIGVHFGLFMNAITSQGTEEQQEKYLLDIFHLRIIGCFAMTELGHGSYIRGFETTSTYDKTTQEFIVNSPTETSTKFWIGTYTR
jgi:acyl-CoA oxidase